MSLSRGEEVVDSLRIGRPRPRFVGRSVVSVAPWLPSPNGRDGRLKLGTVAVRVRREPLW